MEAQGIAVAEAVGLPFSLKRVRVDRRHAVAAGAAANPCCRRARLLRSVAANEPLEAPWPRLIISIGRRSVPIALAIKRFERTPSPCTSKIRRCRRRLFDLIAAPVHDGFEAPNVVTTFGAVHSVTPSAARRGGASASRRASIRCPTRASPCCSAARAKPSASRRRSPPSFGAELARLARDSERLAARHAVAAHPRRLARRAVRRHQGRAASRLGRHRRQPLFRLPRARRRHRRHRGLGQHGHRGGRHRQAGLCAVAQGQLHAARALPRADAGARRRRARSKASSRPGPMRRSTTPKCVASTIRRALHLETKS